MWCTAARSCYAADPEVYSGMLTHNHLLQVVLYGMAPAVLLGAACCWLRLHLLSHVSGILHGAFQQRKDAALAASSSADASARAAGASVVSQMVDLKTVYRFKDEKQVSILLRDMRVWDEDGVPDPGAAEFGEFVLKVSRSRPCLALFLQAA